MLVGTSVMSRRDVVAYTVSEVAALLGVSTDKVYELVRGRVLPHKRLGRRIIVPRVGFERWLATPEPWESGGG
jgi:excisionase family DNA binding protein